MLILKIMSNQDLPDADPSKEFKLISGVISVSFTTDDATEYEKGLLGYPMYKKEGRRQFATIKMPDGIIEDWVTPDALGDYFDRGGKVIDDWFQSYPQGATGWPSRKTWLSGRYPKSEQIPALLTVSFAKVVITDPSIPGSRVEETHLLTGNCYVLNDRGKTIESFWARRNSHGEQVGEA